MKIENKEQFVLNNQGVTLVDFYADWCGPCRMLLPVIDEIENSIGDDVKILKVNIDDFSELAAKYNISTIPALVYFKNGEEVDRTIGFQPKDSIVEKINNLKK